MTATITKWKKIGELLIEHGIINRDQLVLCLNIQKRTRQKLGEIVIQQGYGTEEEVYRLLAQQLHVDYFEKKFSIRIVAREIYEKLKDKCASYQFIPVFLNDSLYVVAADPLDPEVTVIANELGAQLAITPATNINTILEVLEWSEKGFENIIDAASRNITEGEIRVFLNYLISRAIVEGASDIHIEPGVNVTSIRFRLDSELVPIVSLPLERHDNIVYVLCNESGMDPSEARLKRLDGSFTFKQKNLARDIRFASVPSIWGPSLTLRILNEQGALRLTRLNIDSHSMSYIRQFIRLPHGIVLVTGPTGSGKTTLLYAMLKELNDAKRKILTIEDPVEIKLPGITQVQYNEHTGLTFSEALKSFLRHDPDIILVGEIRDKETLQEAFRASITGHLVFATLHTNSAIETIIRLYDLGLEPYMFTAVEGITGIRLVKKLCPKCKIAVPVSEFLSRNREYYRYFSEMDYDREIYFPGTGCPSCNEGYSGRVPVMEVLPITKRLKTLIMKGATIEDIVDAAKTEGFISMDKKGLDLVKEGITTIYDVLKVVKI